MNRKIILIIINCIIVISTSFISITGIFFGAGDGQVGTYIIGWGYFKPYTMDSNIFTAIVALFVLVYCIKDKEKDVVRLPEWLVTCYLACNTCLVLTFLIAAAFLAPMKVAGGGNYLSMFSKDMFFFHFLNPMLATASFVLLVKGRKISYKKIFKGIIPTVIYSIVYFLMVVILKRWSDFYGFTFGGKYYLVPVVLIVIYGLSMFIAYMLIKLHNHFIKK